MKNQTVNKCCILIGKNLTPAHLIDFLQSFDKEVGNSSYDTDEDTSDEENDDDDGK